jgi:hypothetical protein
MKKRIIYARNVNIRQQIRDLSFNTSNLFIKEQSTCKECDHLAFLKNDLTQQQQSMHEENNSPYEKFEYQATD